MILKCSRCGNMMPSPPFKIGSQCGKKFCGGSLVFHLSKMPVGPQKLMVQCKTCGIVYHAQKGKNIFDTCNVGGCKGKLDRYRG